MNKKYFVVNFSNVTIEIKGSSYKRFRYHETFEDAKKDLIGYLKESIKMDQHDLKLARKIKKQDVVTKRRTSWK